jgi:hypothetical protein
MSVIHQSVLDAWHNYSEPLEGRVSHPYLDLLGLVTTGVGNLVDDKNKYTPNSMFALPWRVDGRELATKAEINLHWQYLKSRQDLAKKHYKYAEQAFKDRFGHVLTLSDEAIDALVMKRLGDFASYSVKMFPEFPGWPADAQLGLLSMLWALGSLTKFPNLRLLLAKQDFEGAARGAPATAQSPGWGEASYACKIKDSNNPGVRPRNQNNVKCFRNAAVVRRDVAPIETLHWPNTISAFEAPTLKPPRPEPLRPTLRIGDRGDHVKYLQEKLGIDVDGHFGPDTRSAVMVLQHQNKLNPDGVVGPKTWSLIK